MFPLDELCRRLRGAGMTDVPDRFSIAPVHQEIPRAVLAGIEELIRVFERVTTREAWQTGVTAQSKRPETCFFSAWDFHIPPEHPEAWQLIEFNDNGSGFVFAALLNHHHHELTGLSRAGRIEAPAEPRSFEERLVAMIRAESESFLGGPPTGLVLVVDDAEALEKGRFRNELAALRDLCRGAGWRSDIAAPADTTWDGRRLLCRGEPVAFIVNRSTDFLWDGSDWSAVRAAYVDRSVYVAPNPFTYTTRSDKRLLAWLSTSARDRELGVLPDERAVLSAHVPETRLLREDDVDELALAREDWFFKPCHGSGGRGVLPGGEIGRTRLRRLLKKGTAYVAQRRVPKPRLATEAGVSLWADLRVWAYRGERFLLSGRASREPDLLDLTPPGGWLPTYARLP